MKHSHKGYKLPDGLKIGVRFLLSFDSASPQPGRLQDMSKDGALCIDVAPECQPPRDTPVNGSTMPQSPLDFRFSSEILGRRQLDGRLPVLLVKAPNRLEKQQRRNSFRISAALKARATWEEDETLSKPAVLTNLSGGGARLYMRWLPQTDRLMLSISEDGRGPIYALAASFVQPSDSSFRLVSYLERQALQRGVQDLALIVATAA